MNIRISKTLYFGLLATALWACSKSDQAYGGESSGAYPASTEAAPPPASPGGAQGYSMAKSADGTASTDAAEESDLKDSPGTAVTKAEGFLSSSAATMSRDSSKKFVRTADLRFEVQDVRTATLQTEAVIGHFDGWVTNTSLQSEVVRTNVTPVSADSSLEEKFFVVRNDMVLRVPQAQLDTTLKVLSRMIEYLDYRVIGAEDVSLQMMFETLKQQRNERYNKRVGSAIDDKGNKLNQIADAEYLRMQAQAAADDALMGRIRIADQIQYSTISLHIYQREVVRRTLIPNYKNIDAYRPGFFSRLGDAISSGWSGFLELILALMTAWPLLVLIGGAVGTFVWLRRRNRKAK